MSKIEKLIQSIKESKKIVAYSTECEHDEYGFTGDETDWRRQYLINYERTECVRTECYKESYYPDEDPVWTGSKEMKMTIDEAIDDIVIGWVNGYGFDARTTRIAFIKLDGTVENVTH